MTGRVPETPTPSARGDGAARAACRQTAPLLRFLRNRDGIAAVEFAMVLPILLLLWIGGVEVTQMLSVDRRVANLAASVGDLAARSQELTYADVEGIFDIGPAAMYPYAGDTTSVVLSAVDIDEEGRAEIAWSRARGGVSAHAEDADVTSMLSASLRVPLSQLVMAEVFHSHTPTIGYAITGQVTLDTRAFYAPRVAPRIRLCDNSRTNCR